MSANDLLTSANHFFRELVVSHLNPPITLRRRDVNEKRCWRGSHTRVWNNRICACDAECWLGLWLVVFSRHTVWKERY